MERVLTDDVEIVREKYAVVDDNITITVRNPHDDDEHRITVNPHADAVEATLLQ